MTNIVKMDSVMNSCNLDMCLLLPKTIYTQIQVAVSVEKHTCFDNDLWSRTDSLIEINDNNVSEFAQKCMCTLPLLKAQRNYIDVCVYKVVKNG